ncbi:MAG: type II toxin-antitoxin system VapC family toxin [Halopenitus sp.]
MPTLYFDTCALVKQYYREKGHKKVKSLIKVQGNDIVLSNIGAVEISSVLKKKHRTNELSETNAKKRLSRFIFDGQNRYKLFPVTKPILGEAIGLVSKHDLRSLDAIHLATARNIQQNAQNLQFITSDRDLFNAADNENMQPMDPEGNLP